MFSMFEHPYDLAYMAKNRWYISGIVFKSVADVEDLRDTLDKFLESNHRLK